MEKVFEALPHLKIIGSFVGREEYNKEEWSDIYEKLYDSLGWFEMLAVGVVHGVYDYYLIKQSFGNALIAVWKAHPIPHIVEYARSSTEGDTIEGVVYNKSYCELEDLVKRLEDENKLNQKEID